MLAQRFGTISALFNATREDIEEIPDIGPIVASHILAFLQEKHNQTVIDALIRSGIRWDEVDVEAPSDSPFKDKTVVITGTLARFSRTEAKELLKKLGAKVAGSVSKKTDMLIVGENPGSKVSVAQKHNVTIVDENQLIAFLDGSDSSGK